MTALAPESADLGSLSELAPELADMLVRVASDIVLVVTPGGVIERVAHSGSKPIKAITAEWVGRVWADTVTHDTRKKVEGLLKDVAENGISRSRQVNHPSPFGLDVPVAYSAVRLGRNGPLLVVGRDMSVVSAMQQRLVQVQQDMEHDYWQRRQAGTRYELMFQIATDPVLVVDAASLRIVDANRAVSKLFDRPLERLIGERAAISINSSSPAAVEQLLADARAGGKAVAGEVTLPGQAGSMQLSVTPFRSDATTVLLLRLRAIDAGWQTPAAGSKLTQLLARTPDAIVITDDDGCVQIANSAFIALVQLQQPHEVSGRALAEWVGATRSELPAMLAQLRAEGAVPLLATTVRGARGQLLAVELSAARVPCEGDESFGFIIRAAHDFGAELKIGAVRPAGPLH